MTEQRPGRRARHWGVSVVAVLAMLAGGTGGYLIGRRAEQGPPIQSVIDFLVQPIPAPKGATVLQYRLGPSALTEGGVTYGGDIVLDITGLNASEYQGVVSAYMDHFQRRFPTGDNRSAGWTHLIKSDDRFEPCMGGDAAGWTVTCDDHAHYHLALEAQVIDFEAKPRTGAASKRTVPSDWDKPPEWGQRILWIRLSFDAKGLSGVGKWPGRT